jgi:hypothetical protein
MYLQKEKAKNLEKKFFFVEILKDTDQKSRILSVPKCHGFTTLPAKRKI